MVTFAKLVPTPYIHFAKLALTRTVDAMYITSHAKIP